MQLLGLLQLPIGDQSLAHLRSKGHPAGSEQSPLCFLFLLLLLQSFKVLGLYFKLRIQIRQIFETNFHLPGLINLTVKELHLFEYGVDCLLPFPGPNALRPQPRSHRISREFLTLGLSEIIVLYFDLFRLSLVD